MINQENCPVCVRLASSDECLTCGGTGSVAPQSEVVPVIGMPATIQMVSDQHAATVVDVEFFKNGKVKSILVQRDEAVALNSIAFTEDQKYEYRRNPRGQLTYATLSKARGRWEGDSVLVYLGNRREYRDPSF